MLADNWRRELEAAMASPELQAVAAATAAALLLPLLLRGCRRCAQRRAASGAAPLTWGSMPLPAFDYQVPSSPRTRIVTAAQRVGCKRAHTPAIAPAPLPGTAGCLAPSSRAPPPVFPAF
jgi:hypothetical protein